MNDDAPRKRPWFQIHLSTAVVLMVVAGVLVWANVRKPVVLIRNSRIIELDRMGWPWNAESSIGGYLDQTPDQAIRNARLRYFGTSEFYLNLITALAILTAVAVGCEYLIRRREKAMKQGS